MAQLEEHYNKFSSVFLILIFVAGLIVGGLAGSYVIFRQIDTLADEVANLKAQISGLHGTQNITYQNVTIFQNSTALAEIYEEVKDSVVFILGTTSEGTSQGSGFVYEPYSGTVVVITNYHVVHDTSSVSVTFSNGNGYSATVNGTDPYADLAVLSVDAPEYEFKPLEVVNSSTLRVGDPAIAIGNPYGLVGSMTTGVVSALGRTITEEYTGGFGIANIIQTSTPINPGNSGGPLLNFYGKVVGITTAIVADSQGLGFAIPSNTLLREIFSLIEYGTYTGHSYLGLKGTDMDYEMSQQLGTSITYGWRIVEVTQGGPSQGKLQIDDIIFAMSTESSGETRIRNSDDLSSFLVEHTSPGETVTLAILRGDSMLDVHIVLGNRPAPSV